MTTPTKLRIPKHVWEFTLDAFAAYAKSGVEAGLIWYGIKSDPTSVAVLVGVPQQTNRPQYFEIAGDDLAALTHVACSFGLVAVAQVHIHPGTMVNHSEWDDERVISRRVYSLVLPLYGARPCDLADAGVHRFCDGRWRLLTPVESAATVQLLPATIDLR